MTGREAPEIRTKPHVCDSCRDYGKIEDNGVQFYCSCAVGRFLFDCDIRTLWREKHSRPEVIH